MAVWDDVLGDTDRKVFEAAGWGRPDGFDLGVWNLRSWRAGDDTDVAGHLGNEIVAEVAPRPGDLLVEKKKPSAFFDTPLASYLVSLRADTLLLCGTTTSSYNFRGGIPEPCVWDRGELTHKVNLFDLQQKYCDVLELDEVLGYLDGLELGLFDAEFPAVRDAGGVAR